MSGLYLIAIVVLWVCLTWLLLWLGWHKAFKKKKGITTRKLLVGLVILAWLGASFWYGGGQKIYYDWRVDQMCAVDGGVKVYEKVELPTEKFNKWGQPNFYKPTQKENALGPEYVYRWKRKYYQSGNPVLTSLEIAMARDWVQIIRKSDMKILGEVVRYYRAGGDLPGPWMPSSYYCPPSKEANEITLIINIFVIDEKEVHK